MNYKGLLPFIFFITTLSSVLNAQEMNNELKKRLRESLLTPEMPPTQRLRQQDPFQVGVYKNPDEVLKASPFTRLHTKYDRIRLPPKIEEFKVQMRIIPTNAPPINMRPPGSTEYVHDFGRMSVRSNAGELVVPSGRDSGPIRKKHKKNANLLNRLQK